MFDQSDVVLTMAVPSDGMGKVYEALVHCLQRFVAGPLVLEQISWEKMTSERGLVFNFKLTLHCHLERWLERHTSLGQLWAEADGDKAEILWDAYRRYRTWPATTEVPANGEQPK